ncbi:MAG TPA: metallophosphoesterase [Planctomycetota bacterium]
MSYPPALVARIETALSRVETKATAEQRVAVHAVLQRAHAQAFGTRDRAAAEVESRIDQPEFAHVLSALRQAPAGESLAEFELPGGTTADGMILGTGKYEALDPGWLEAAAAWLEHLFDHAPWPEGAPEGVRIPDQATLALLGDWGTGAFGDETAPALQIAQWLDGRKKGDPDRPDVLVHLGDVYYDGTCAREKAHLLHYWPTTYAQSFALNSNHEMYAGAHGLFQEVLTGRGRFAAQGCHSQFVLKNAHWRVIGLDTAYFSDRWNGYMSGRLDPKRQVPWLRAQVERAKVRGQRLLLLSHHNGLDLAGAKVNALWHQVRDVVRHGDFHWYWGHIHAAAAYQPVGGVLARCNGHGGVPWGRATDLADSPRAEWYESQEWQAPKVHNGFVTLSLDGAEITETFRDEQGRVRWTNQP